MTRSIFAFFTFLSFGWAVCATALGGCGAPDADPVPMDMRVKAEPPTVRVLFLGNSYTSVNDLPKVVATLSGADQSPVRFVVDQLTPGGETWEGHDANPAVTELLQKGWDWVVLQDQSEQPWMQAQVIKSALLSLDAKVKAAGAKTALYMTWARQEDPAEPTAASIRFNQDMRVNLYYQRAGDTIGAAVAPVGRAWDRALRTTPIILHDSDRSHPNPRGTYLAACVFYATLTGQSPIGLGDGGLGIDSGDRMLLQQIAWDTIGSRARPSPPLLGNWPLAGSAAGTPIENDLERSDALVLGDTLGPSARLPRGTQFGPDRFAAIPYFAGMNADHVTVVLYAHRSDWTQAPGVRQFLIGKWQGYEIYQDDLTLKAQVHPVSDSMQAPMTYQTDQLTPGWHQIALTYDGTTTALWIDSRIVASQAKSGPLQYWPVIPHLFPGIAVGQQPSYTSEAVDLTQLANGFTGALAGIRIFDRALNAVELAAM